MADETNLYVWDSGSGKFVKFTQPSGAAQAQVVHSTLDSVGDSTLVRLSEAYCYFYLSTKPTTAVTLPASGAPGVDGDWTSIMGGTSIATSLVYTGSEALCTHASPGSFTYQGIGADLAIQVAGSILLADANEYVDFAVRRLRGAAPAGYSYLNGFYTARTSGVGHVSGLVLHCNDTAVNGDVYTIVGRTKTNSSQDVTLQSLSVHADGAVGNDVVNDNIKKLATLTAALRSALYDIKLIKGGA